MLPRSYRGRYSIVILFSLLIHVAVLVFVLMEYGDFFKAEKTEKTITVKLNQQKEEKKEQSKKEEPKKEEPKKEEPKKEEPKKEEPKKEEPKKEEPKKEEPKKEEPKKEESKKEEPKKEEPKKEEPKKAEPKKAEPKKAEPKKGEPKKGEPSKGEPKKGEPKKGEPKKGEPSKGEPKKGEPMKAEPKQGEPQKAQHKKGEPPLTQAPFNPYQTSMDMYGTPEPFESDSKRKGEPLPVFGSMQMLDDREMKKQVVYTSGYDSRFQKRELDAQKLTQSLSVEKKQELSKHLVSQAKYIFSHFAPPKKDGREYFGEVSILLNEEGEIETISLKKPSGNNQLDSAAIQAAQKSIRLLLPEDSLLRLIMTTKPLTITYNHTDMAD